ncbi:MAG: response regulator [Planctomycetes bacterium]|nr:response regulator [Planctomycetota bacterium]
MSKTNILIVENEIILAKYTQVCLKKLGYTVSGTASSGKEAIQKASETRPNLVLMDIRLDGKMDGIEAARQIKENFSIPVVYLTAHADDATLKRAKITEPYGYILKPFEDRDLHIGIEIALYKHSADKKSRKLSHAIEQSSNVIIITDAEGKIEYVNPRFTWLTLL